MGLLALVRDNAVLGVDCFEVFLVGNGQTRIVSAKLADVPCPKISTRLRSFIRPIGELITTDYGEQPAVSFFVVRKGKKRLCVGAPFPLIDGPDVIFPCDFFYSEVS